MEKITVKELIDFTRKTSDNSKKNFAYKLKERKPKLKSPDDNTSTGDYWVTSTSSIYNVIKNNEQKFYDLKIDELNAKVNASNDKKVKSMHQRNIDILTNFKDFNIKEVRPAKILKVETVHKSHKVLELVDFPVYANPSFLYSHERNGKKELGAIWLAPKLNGYKKHELGMFCELLHELLIKHYADSYQISDDLCIAIDTFNAQKVSFSEMAKGNVPFLIQSTLKEINDIH